LEYIYKRLKKGSQENIEDAIEFMDDMGITNDHFKEHLMVLNMSDVVK